jgi:hypothetical protein
MAAGVYCSVRKRRRLDRRGVRRPRAGRRFKKPASSPPARVINKLSVSIVKAAQPPARQHTRSCASLFAPVSARYDGIIISDYGKGVIHEELLDVVGERVAQS